MRRIETLYYAHMFSFVYYIPNPGRLSLFHCVNVDCWLIFTFLSLNFFLNIRLHEESCAKVRLFIHVHIYI